MYKKNNNVEKILIRKIKQLNEKMNQNNFSELTEILGNPKKMFYRNFFAGVFKGIGIGIGFSVLTAVLIYFLQKLVKLNIPVLGDYISDIIDIVQTNKK